MDFFTQLPVTARGYDAISTFFDRFSKRIHRIPSKTDDTVEHAAISSFHNTFRLHGLPDAIVSDRDPRLTSRFWGQLMGSCGIKLKMATSKQPQMDGLT